MSPEIGKRNHTHVSIKIPVKTDYSFSCVRKKVIFCRAILLSIADIFRGVRDDMRDGELGGGDSLHQVFVLSQVRGNPGDVCHRKFHRGRPASSACELIYLSKFLIFLSFTLFSNDDV